MKHTNEFKMSLKVAENSEHRERFSSYRKINNNTKMFYLYSFQEVFILFFPNPLDQSGDFHQLCPVILLALFERSDGWMNTRS